MDLIKAILVAFLFVLLFAALSVLAMIALPIVLFLGLILVCWFIIKLCQDEKPPDDQG